MVTVGTPVLVGDKLVPMPVLGPGDRLVAVPRAGALLVIGSAALAAAAEAVGEAERAFAKLADSPAESIDRFFTGFAERLADDRIWAAVEEANRLDVARAQARGRAIGRLRVSEKMRAAMIEGLSGWAASRSRIGEVIERRAGDGYRVERRRAPLGVIAFVFEGRPNVFADGAGVVKSGNTCVMRIGGDALDTALTIEERALRPALSAAGLPEATVRLVRSRDHGAGQALFTLGAVRLAVARGSGPTVALLGSIAEQHGIPVSLHGTGGAWMYVDETATPLQVKNAIHNSLDRKVCNTLNVLMIDRAAVAKLGPAVGEAMSRRGARVHACRGAEGLVAHVAIIDESELSHEWEWDDVPECSVVVARDREHAIGLVNQHSAHFVASILSNRVEAFEDFYRRVDAPYIGNAFTRWVDGQWAWSRPELGLTNWQRGRLLGRSGFLSGDDIYTVRDVFIDETGEAGQAR
ncbi:MAG TPA: aldehyde dehydrogenase family protein [Anaeromyxobacteraceae bacterium]|nr:aldehyde dehydrogenase family protein [Anaeromyxobacteraceae bacterium]